MPVFNNILAGAAGQTGGAAAPAGATRSLRFNPGDSAYLNKTFSSGNRRTFTYSYWIKECGKGTSPSNNPHVLWSGTGSATRGGLVHRGTGSDANKLYIFNQESNTTNCQVWTNSLHRDFLAWKHIVWSIDTTQATSTNRVKLYINGVQETLNFVTTPAQNLQLQINVNQEHRIGRGTPDDYGNFYLADVQFVDGSALDATSFGAFDDNGVWQHAEYDGSYGTNGFHLLDFANESTVGHDSSGNENDFTANNISTTAGAGNDVLFDVPTNGTQSDTGAGGEVSGNYATLNALQYNSGGSVTLSNGNLELNTGATAAWNTTGSTIAVSSGKWLCEVTIDTLGTYTSFGVSNPTSVDVDTYMGIAADSYTWFAYSGAGIYTNNAYIDQTSPWGAGTFPAAGDVVGMALDMDAGTLKYYLNGSLVGTAFTGITGPVMFCDGSYGGSVHTYNFGQRAFAYPVSGYKALCTANLPTPTIADGSDHFDAKTYTGNGSTQSITTAFSPDFVWIKRRSFSQSHQLVDTVRGYDKYLFADVADDELTDTDRLTSFNSDGFTIGADSNVNTNNGTYVGWAWDGGSSTVTNTDGDITSSVRANTSAGFSIVSYTGSSAIQNYTTVGHGLNATPEVIIVKNRTYTSGISWRVYHASAGENKSAPLDTNDSFSSGYWNATAPTSSVFSVTNNSVDVNNSSHSYIAYCWTSIEGYSKFSEFTGNGSADGTFVYTGFRPRWILIKRKDANANWRVLDTARRTYNPNNKELYPSLSNAEATFTALDVLSNGFKLRTGDSNYNLASNDYVYMAFAEHPFKTARAF